MKTLVAVATSIILFLGTIVLVHKLVIKLYPSGDNRRVTWIRSRMNASNSH